MKNLFWITGFMVIFWFGENAYVNTQNNVNQNKIVVNNIRPEISQYNEIEYEDYYNQDYYTCEVFGCNDREPHNHQNNHARYNIHTNKHNNSYTNHH